VTRQKSTTKYNCKIWISSTALILTTEVHKHTFTSQFELKQTKKNSRHLDHNVLGSSLLTGTKYHYRNEVGHTTYRQLTRCVHDYRVPVFTWWYVGTLHFFLVLLWAA